MPMPKAPHLCVEKYCRNPRHQKRRFCARHIMQQWRSNNPITSLLNIIRQRAKRKRLSFTLDLQTFKSFCLTRWSPGQNLHIDRIDPTDGYHLHNIQVIHASENIAKGNRERHSPRYQAFLAIREQQSENPY